MDPEKSARVDFSDAEDSQVALEFRDRHRHIMADKNHIISHLSLSTTDRSPSF